MPNAATTLNESAPRRTRSKTRHEDMLNEAARQLNRNGFSLTSLKEIASALQVSRRALYHYIEDREDLVYQCYIRSCEIAQQHLDRAVADGTDALDIIQRLVDYVFAADQPELCAITELGLLPDEKRQDVDRRYELLVEQLALTLEKGADEGIVRHCDYEIAARSALGVIFWLPLADPWSTALPDRARQLQFTKEFLLNGWSAEPRQLPEYREIDISVLRVRTVKGFDRDGLAEAKREQILAAASRLFNRKGIDATSLDEIARELDATTMAVYHYIGGKPALVAECYFRMMRMARALQQAAYTEGQPIMSGIASFHQAWALAQMEEDIAPLTPMTGFNALTKEAQDKFHAASSELTSVAREQVERGQAEGSVREMDIDAMRLNVGVTGWLSKGLIKDPAARLAAAREASAFIAVGLRAL